jgi:hypothetical protein
MCFRISATEFIILSQFIRGGAIISLLAEYEREAAAVRAIAQRVPNN